MLKTIFVSIKIIKNIELRKKSKKTLILATEKNQKKIKKI